jgi:hypothetical protein
VADDELFDEPEDAGDDDVRVPAELLELHEVLEWNAALEAEEPSS